MNKKMFLILSSILFCACTGLEAVKPSACLFLRQRVHNLQLEKNQTNSPTKTKRLMGTTLFPILQSFPKSIKRSTESKKSLLEAQLHIFMEVQKTKLAENTKLTRRYRKAAQESTKLVSLVTNWSLEYTELARKNTESARQHTKTATQSTISATLYTKSATLYTESAREHTNWSLEYTERARKHTEDALENTKDVLFFTKLSQENTDSALEYTEGARKYTEAARENTEWARKYTEALWKFIESDRENTKLATNHQTLSDTWSLRPLEMYRLEQYESESDDDLYEAGHKLISDDDNSNAAIDFDDTCDPGSDDDDETDDVIDPSDDEDTYDQGYREQAF